MNIELISVLIAVLAIGAAWAGLILTSNRGLRQDMCADWMGESVFAEQPVESSESSQPLGSSVWLGDQF